MNQKNPPQVLRNEMRADSVPVDEHYSTEGYFYDNPILTRTGIFKYKLEDGLILQGFVIEHTVADPLEARICNGILELLAHTFGCLCALPAAGAVPAGALESFSDGADNLLIGIELDFHVRQLFLDCGFIIPQDKVFFCDEVTLIKKNPVLFEHRILRM